MKGIQSRTGWIPGIRKMMFFNKWKIIYFLLTL